MAWPQDSWICKPNCEAPRIKVVVPDGHWSAERRPTASVAVRSALPTKSMPSTNSQPAQPCWRMDWGYERRCTSPCPRAVAIMPPPASYIVCSTWAPSLLAKVFFSLLKIRFPDLAEIPLTEPRQSSAAKSSPSFSSGEIVKGSTSIGVIYVPLLVTGAPRETGLTAYLAAAFAISTAKSVARSISAAVIILVEANPQVPFTRPEHRCRLTRRY